MTKIFLICLIFLTHSSSELISCPSEEETPRPLRVVLEEPKSIKSLQNIIVACLEEYPRTTILFVQVEGIVTDDPAPKSDYVMPPMPYAGLVTYTPEKLPPKARGGLQNTMVDYLKGLMNKGVPIIFMSHLLLPFQTIERLKFLGLVSQNKISQRIPLTDSVKNETYYYGVYDNFIWNALIHIFPQKLNKIKKHFYQYATFAPLLFFSADSAWEQVIIVDHTYKSPAPEEFLEGLKNAPYYNSLEEITLIEIDSFVGWLKEEE